MVTLNNHLASSNTQISRIEILGVFGAGKTTFAGKLAGLGHHLILEDHNCNPFWGHDDKLKRAGNLAYDLSFLIHHLDLISSISNRHKKLPVCDWSLTSDHLWASMRLSSELHAYECVHSEFVKRIGSAKGYIYLVQTPSVIIDRIQRRARAQEAPLKKDIICAVDALDRLLGGLHNVPILEVHSDGEKNGFDQELATWMETVENHD